MYLYTKFRGAFQAHTLKHLNSIQTKAYSYTIIVGMYPNVLCLCLLAPTTGTATG
jgi:hypothetical protein